MRRMLFGILCVLLVSLLGMGQEDVIPNLSSYPAGLQEKVLRLCEPASELTDQEIGNLQNFVEQGYSEEVVSDYVKILQDNNYRSAKAKLNALGIKWGGAEAPVYKETPTRSRIIWGGPNAPAYGEAAIEKVTVAEIREEALTDGMSDEEVVRRIMESIKWRESRKRYHIIGPRCVKGYFKGQHALGAYQIMPSNMRLWTKKITGRAVSNEEFLKDPKLQDRVAYDNMMRYWQRFRNVDDVASMWFSGYPYHDGLKDVCDVTGTMVPDYIADVRGYFNNL